MVYKFYESELVKIVKGPYYGYEGIITWRWHSIDKNYYNIRVANLRMDFLMPEDEIDHAKKFEIKTMDVPSLYPTIYNILTKRMNVKNTLTCSKEIPGIKKVIYNGQKTIILWGDNTKTVVSCKPGDTYDEYNGFCAAVCKKLFGNSTRVRKIVESDIVYREAKND